MAPALLALAALAAPLLLGCPPGTCFIKTCVNGVCKCPVNSCQDGADFDLNINACACKQGFFTVQGQCLDKGHADAWAAVLIGLGVLVLALGHARSAKRWPRLLARATGTGVALLSLGVFAAPGVAMLR